MVPPALVHPKVYVYKPAVDIAPVDAVPPVGVLAPVQLPLAVQEEGLFVVDHVMVELPPVVNVLGLKLIFTPGSAITVTVADPEPLPALLEQLKLYVYVPAVDIVPVPVLPLPPLDPVQLPLAVQDVGLFVAAQLIVELEPTPILVGVVDIVTTGADTGVPPDVTAIVVVAVPVPPPFVQDRV